MTASAAVINLISELEPKQTGACASPLLHLQCNPPPPPPRCLWFHTSLRKQGAENGGEKAAEVCEQGERKISFLTCAAAKLNGCDTGKCSTDIFINYHHVCPVMNTGSNNKHCQNGLNGPYVVVTNTKRLLWIWSDYTGFFPFTWHICQSCCLDHSVTMSRLLKKLRWGM